MIKMSVSQHVQHDICSATCSLGGHGQRHLVSGLSYEIYKGMQASYNRSSIDFLF